MNRNSLVGLLFTILALSAFAADQPGFRARLLRASKRKPAPEFKLEDSSGKTVTLAQYRGQVVLLDFWATWCHGCKEEIPWFAEFHRQYGSRGLAVIGVSLDDDGWKAVKPFIESTKVPYRIVLGNDDISKMYGIGGMPDTFLIDRRGRLAAIYTGMVDKDNLEANIKAILAKR